MSSPFYPPAGFAFRLSLEGDCGTFQEVSGIALPLDTESLGESGEQTFAHRLPHPSRPTNLLLQRGSLKVDGALCTWCRNLLSDALATPVEVKNLVVELVDVTTAATVLKRWVVSRARPIRWEIVEMNANNADIAIEALELAHEGLALE